VHPEQIRGFLDLVDHPWVRGVSAAVLGDDYEIVEIGFDIPFPGARNQPWHRDFPMPEETRKERRLTSLAFNITTVDTTEDMGPFEIAPGTQWDDSPTFDHGMFPPKDEYERYDALAQRKYPQMGDISVRSALTVHRGTINHSQLSRPGNDALVRRGPAGAGATASEVPRRGRAHADHPEAHHRGPGHG
jgi:ectoine hydroxylase-related dioxygenase (phytanoyl-CoA dioxygenase family)